MSLTSLESSAFLIFDASVTINFLGTGQAVRLLDLIGRPVVMADRTFTEIKRHPLVGRDHVTELQEIIHAGHMEIRGLDGAAKELFFDLASADISGGLDDGEAATIALAITMSDYAAPVLDDRKARNLLLRRWPNRYSAYTVDLLAEARISNGMARSELAEAVYSALRHARMRVPAETRPWVSELIGKERAAQCRCLGISP